MLDKEGHDDISVGNKPRYVTKTCYDEINVIQRESLFSSMKYPGMDVDSFKRCVPL